MNYDTSLAARQRRLHLAFAVIDERRRRGGVDAYIPDEHDDPEIRQRWYMHLAGDVVKREARQGRTGMIAALQRLKEQAA